MGRYLGDGLETLLRCAPPNVAVRLHRAKAECVCESADGWRVEAAGANRAFDEVLIAVGHQDTSATGLAADWTHAAPLVPAVFPVDRWLTRRRVPPGQRSRSAASHSRSSTPRWRSRRAAAARSSRSTIRTGSATSPGRTSRVRILPFTRTGRPMLAKPGPRTRRARTPELGAHRGRGPDPASTALARPLDLQRDVEPILAAVAAASLESPHNWGQAPVVRVEPGRPVWLAHSVRAIGNRTIGARPQLCARPGGGDRAVAGCRRRARAAGKGVGARACLAALYPAIVSQLSGDGLAAGDWPAFLRLAAEMERIAFGPPPVNAAKLLALVEAGRVDLTYLRGGAIVLRDGRTFLQSKRGSEPIDVAVDAVLPGPGARGHGGLLADLVARGHARVAPGRRGLDVTADGTCRAADGSLSPGLSAIGRPTEDSVIGNDTLSRTLHPHADRWAESVVRRCRERLLARDDIREREAAPA